MSKSTNWLDGAAVALSAVCLVHCLALPLIVAGLPFLAQFSDGHLHAQMLIVVLPLSIVALSLGFRRHRSWRIVAAGTLGMLLLTTGATLAHVHLGLTADRLLTIAGALTLGAAHFVNSYRSKLARYRRSGAGNRRPPAARESASAAGPGTRVPLRPHAESSPLPSGRDAGSGTGS